MQVEGIGPREKLPSGQLCSRLTAQYLSVFILMYQTLSNFIQPQLVLRRGRQPSTGSEALQTSSNGSKYPSL